MTKLDAKTPKAVTGGTVCPLAKAPCATACKDNGSESNTC